MSTRWGTRRLSVATFQIHETQCRRRVLWASQRGGAAHFVHNICGKDNSLRPNSLPWMAHDHLSLPRSTGLHHIPDSLPFFL